MSEPDPADVPAELSPGVRAYSFVCMGALSLMVVALVLRRPDPWVLMPALLGALGLLFRWRAGPLLVLLAVVVLLGSWWLGTDPGWLTLSVIGWVRRWLAGYWMGYFRLRQMALPMRGSRPFPDLLLALSLLAYAAAQYRLQGLTGRLFPPDPRLRGAAARGGKVDEARRRAPELVTPGEIVVLLAALPACAGLGSLFWAWLRGQVTDLEMSDAMWQGLLVLWLPGGAVLVATALLRYLALRRMTPAEAEMFLQDVLWRETRREQRRLNRWLAWAWLRRRRREKEPS